jgi:hypothetical protein
MYGPRACLCVFHLRDALDAQFRGRRGRLSGGVLIRAIYPTEGIERIAARRAGRPRSIWTDGPGKLCQALAIDRTLNGHDLCAAEAELFVENGVQIPDSSVTISPRVGLNNVPEPWKSIPWRFQAQTEAVRLNLGSFARSRQKDIPFAFRPLDLIPAGERSTLRRNMPKLLQGKNALIFGVANERSIAWGIAKAFHEHGAHVALSYAGEALERRARPLAESIGASFLEPCDVADDEQIRRVAG